MTQTKKIIIAGIFILLVTILGISLFFILKPKQNNLNNLIEINGHELLEKMKNKETFILVRTQDGCSHCEEYKPIINRILVENNIYAYELNSTKLNKEEESIKNEINKLFNISGTPTTIFINEGEEKSTINRIAGSSSYSTIKKILKDRGFIN